jgi:hypothetical protein
MQGKIIEVRDYLSAAANGGCACRSGGSPEIFSGIRNGFRNLRAVFWIPLPRNNDRCHFDFWKSRLIFRFLDMRANFRNAHFCADLAISSYFPCLRTKQH